jgi:hypothetical protein
VLNYDVVSPEIVHLLDVRNIIVPVQNALYDKGRRKREDKESTRTHLPPKHFPLA